MHLEHGTACGRTGLSFFLSFFFQMVVFQQSVWDRLDACAMAVLPLVVCEQVQRVLGALMVLACPHFDPRSSGLTKC